MTNSEAIRIINQYDCNFYWTDGEKIPTDDLIDAFELAVKALDETEPRVLTLEEATGDDECWLETKAGAYGYADVYMCSGHQCVEAWRCLNKKAEYLPFSTYLKLWRCWSARPTDEQREAVPWTE